MRRPSLAGSKKWNNLATQIFPKKAEIGKGDLCRPLNKKTTKKLYVGVGINGEIDSADQEKRKKKKTARARRKKEKIWKGRAKLVSREGGE